MEYIVQFFTALSIGERFLYILLGIYLAYKGIIKVPFIPIGNKRKPIDRALKIWMIKTKQTLYEQMNIVEVIHANLTFKMNALYSETKANESDKQHYKLLTERMEKECKSFVRKWCKENHFTSRSDTEFCVYISEKVDFLIELVIIELNKSYTDNKFSVSREAIHDINEDRLIPYAKEKWRKMFYDIREVSKTNEALIQRLENE